MNAIELLDDTCARYPEATALAWGVPDSGHTLSFGDLADRSRRLAALFHRSGLRPGDAVAIFIPMSGPLYEVMAAVLRSGLIPVFVDPALWRESMYETVANLPLRGFIGTPAACAARWFVPSLRRVPYAFVAGRALPGAIPLGAAAHCKPAASIEPCSDRTISMVTFTSGSTGRPKGVMRSHGTLLATHRILSKHLVLRACERIMTTLPFIVFVNLAAGASTVIPEFDLRHPASATPERLVRQLREWKICGLVVTPYVARRVAEFCRRRAVALDSLRHVCTGGALVLPELLEEISAVAPRAQTGAIYGATEVEPIAFADLSDFGSKERRAIRDGHGVLAGRPIDEIAVRVLTDRWGISRPPCSTSEFEHDSVPNGTHGEIVVCGPNVSPGYLDGEGNTQQKIVVNDSTWHRTGDAGYFDESGRLWLTGRCAAKIVRNGETFYPQQIEAASAGLRAVERATLITNGYQRSVLVVQPTGDPEAVDIGELTARLAWCKPQEIIMVKHIPMDRRHNAKVNYPELRRAVERQQWLTRMVLSS